MLSEGNPEVAKLMPLRVALTHPVLLQLIAIDGLKVFSLENWAGVKMEGWPIDQPLPSGPALPKARIQDYHGTAQENEGPAERAKHICSYSFLSRLNFYASSGSQRPVWADHWSDPKGQ